MFVNGNFTTLQALSRTEQRWWAPAIDLQTYLLWAVDNYVKFLVVVFLFFGCNAGCRYVFESCWQRALCVCIMPICSTQRSHGLNAGVKALVDGLGWRPRKSELKGRVQGLSQDIARSKPMLGSERWLFNFHKLWMLMEKTLHSPRCRKPITNQKWWWLPTAAEFVPDTRTLQWKHVKMIWPRIVVWRKKTR